MTQGRPLADSQVNPGLIAWNPFRIIRGGCVLFPIYAPGGFAGAFAGGFAGWLACAGGASVVGGGGGSPSLVRMMPAASAGILGK